MAPGCCKNPRTRADPSRSGWYVFLAYLSRLSLTNYRNLVSMELDLPRGVLVFFGPNAQGKTTLLEAAYTMAIARSFRAENEREVVNFDAASRGEMALVGGALESDGSQLQIYVGYQPTLSPRQDNGANHSASRPTWSVRKQIRVSRVRRTATELVGMVHAVLFGADDIDLVFGPPSVRRRFLDILLSQTNPSYVRSLQRYQKVVRQRNRLLKSVAEGRADAQELEFWTDQLVADGAGITWSRHQALDHLAPLATQKHRQLSAADEDLELRYRPSVSVTGDEAELETRFREELASVQARERATATTVVGPHRDDFDLLIEGVDMGTFASRGQARTLALTLKLAEAAYLADTRSEGPLVLLDDVLSEMDSLRRRRVLEQTAQYQQILITTTDLDLVAGYFGDRASYFEVQGGLVKPVLGDLEKFAPAGKDAA